MKTLFTLLVACLSFAPVFQAAAFTKAPSKETLDKANPALPLTQSKPYVLISDKTKTCVLAPTAKTENEKRAVLVAAASEYSIKNAAKNAEEIKSSGAEQELCLAYLANQESGEPINTWKAPGVPEHSVEPGFVKWKNDSKEPVVTINPGFEREDADTYVVALASVMNGKACVRARKQAKNCKPDFKLALKLIHDQLKVTEHPLDWLLAP